MRQNFASASLALLAVVAVLAALAGCGALVDEAPNLDDAPAIESGSSTPVPAESPTPDDATASESASATTDPTPSAGDGSTATAEPQSADNPWGTTIVPVAVNDTVADGRNATGIVRRTIAFWNDRIERYTDWTYRFRFVADEGDARAEVRYVESIAECNGHSERIAGCAPLLSAGDEAPDRAIVRVETYGSNAGVLDTTRHEFGHLLGLDHAAEPRWLMSNGTAGPVRDARDRANPWMTDRVSVLVETESIDGDEERIDAQVGHALAYYEDGAGGTVPDNVTFARADLAHAADVVITDDSARGCESEGSTVNVRGPDRDGDAAPELHTRAVICVDVDEDAVGWHVGAMLGNAFGLSQDDLADPFRDADYEDRRSEWWE